MASSVRFVVLVWLAFLLLSQTAWGHFDPWSAVGRLLADGQSICTAFVWRTQPGASRYRNDVVSAGHCYHGPSKAYSLLTPSGQFPLTYVWHDVSDHRDVLLMTFLSVGLLPAFEPKPGHRLSIGQHVTFLGHTVRASMSATAPVAGIGSDGHFLVDAVAFPGNSGGPVIIPTTMSVVGIVTRFSALSPSPDPSYCERNPCHAIPPYRGIGIDIVLGIDRPSQ